MKGKQINTRKEFRRELRKNLTHAEAYLWSLLKARNFEGIRFTRQHSIGNFIVDFYCVSEKLIIELDGNVHFNSEAELYDQKRSEYFNRLGFKVLRFENNMVLENLQTVLKEIRDNLK